MNKLKNVLLMTIFHLIMAVVNLFLFGLAAFDVFKWENLHSLLAILFFTIALLFLTVIAERHIRLRIEHQILKKCNVANIKEFMEADELCIS